MYFVVREPLEGVPEADCNALVSAYLIGKRQWDAGRRWWMRGSMSTFSTVRQGKLQGLVSEMPRRPVLVLAVVVAVGISR